jgi:FkbM family methyltransferase
MPGLETKLASAAVAAYPFRRGRYFLRQLAARRFLLGRTDFGSWVRVSGVSGFEWKIFDGQYNEPRTIVAMKQLIHVGMTVFDVGANIGYYSLLAANLVGPAGQVHSFEPTPLVVQRLKENIALNDLSSRVTVNAVAVGAAVGMIDFHMHSDDSEGNSMFSSEQHVETVCVPVITLDRYIHDRGIGCVDLMKIDIEGAELLALEGAAELLAREDAPLLTVEFNPSALSSAGTSPLQLKSSIEAFGYRCLELEQLTEGLGAVYNVMAAKPNHIPMLQQCGINLNAFER